MEGVNNNFVLINGGSKILKTISKFLPDILQQGSLNIMWKKAHFCSQEKKNKKNKTFVKT